MKSRYFCNYHLKKIHSNEVEAWQSWSAMMQLGVKAFVECRVDAARNYLSAALDISLLRCDCEVNELFSETHFIKPAEFLLRLYVVEGEFDRARNVLNKIKKASGESNISCTSIAESDGFLSKQYEAIEAEEKIFFTSSRCYKSAYYKGYLLNLSQAHH
ncbi:hypothetical protein SAMN02745866_02517 [Alteromonadaceae bacterium Bs31]|nr:hypothetical protein SAMN02745866_02517 [Alteromonadaceae bacterium Bs31]